MDFFLGAAGIGLGIGLAIGLPVLAIAWGEKNTFCPRCREHVGIGGLK